MIYTNFPLILCKFAQNIELITPLNHRIMERNIYQELCKWKSSTRRKPLILEGARQVGKTWIVRHFGENEYAHVAYINFEEMKNLRGLFTVDFNVERVMRAIRLATGCPCVAGETLIFLDEIQDAEGGLTMLKYFFENMPEQHIIVAGSLLGIELHRKESFPVGKVDFLRMYPMTFIEFLRAVGETAMADLIISADWQTIALFSQQLTERLRQYYFVGGMPEAVQAYANEALPVEIRHIQNSILQSYDNDFSKHAPNELVPRIRLVWDSIPSQLSRENRKFIYGLVKEGARAREFEAALMWLCDCGLTYKVKAVKTPKYPLKSYEDQSAFKLFTIDVGLLCAQMDVEPSLLLQKNDIFTEFKGALTEQYVMQQLLPYHTLYYWSKPNSQAKVDFVIQQDGNVVPIEVKAEDNLRAKSLRLFIDTFAPARAYRLSMSDYRKESQLTNIPLYAIAACAN